MATQGPQHRQHLIAQNTSTAENYTAKKQARDPVPSAPGKERQPHGQHLRVQLAAVAIEQQERAAQLQALNVQSALGVQVEFESEEAVELAAESLARDRQGIELMNVRRRGDQIFATVFVPEGKLTHFEKLVSEYVGYKTDKNGAPRDNHNLIDAIRTLRVASFESLWTDATEALPTNDADAIWWEAWLPLGRHAQQTLADFRTVAELAGLLVSERALYFPERIVAQLHGSKAQLLQSSLVLNMVAELRRAKTTAEFFTGLVPHEQAEWQHDMQARLQSEPAGNSYVTLLDTGINHGHPLLAPFVADEDRHAIEPGWGLDDGNGHGTELAGLALLGDLTHALADQLPLRVAHRLESVKVLRWAGDNEGESHGAITAEAVARVEITAPERRRVFAMAVSSTDGLDRGRPSSWSAEVDRLASDFEGQGSAPRLFVLCAGNTSDSNAWATYPDSLATNSVHDPGQAWNALTVGACSELTTISEVDAQQYVAVAPAGHLSPYTTTSTTWQNGWPFKPDIVMEGGNTAIEPTGFACQMGSLSLLTTSHLPHERVFSLSWATSAATALAAGMCAKIAAAYPDFWPETLRGLMVHSARWTQPMLDTYTPGGVRNRQTLRALLRHCGYGVPSLERALYSAANSLTMIVQDRLQPYYKAEQGGIKTREMHFHDLPWPTDTLAALGNAPVTLRVTLSYFIEPNPGERGGIDKYAYQSHALRFAVRRPLESRVEFKRRINAQADAAEQGLPGAAPGGDAGWTIGEKLRARGSLLSDSWTGTAAELANRGQLAVFPAVGWWRNRTTHQRFDRSARYSLLISIEAPTVDQDLYVQVAQQIAAAVAVEVEVPGAPG